MADSQSPFSRGSASQGAPPTRSVSDWLATGSSTRGPSTPSDTYAKLCKVVLQRRLRHMFTLTATASFLALFIATLTLRNGLSGILHSALRSLLFTPLAFAGSLPIFVLRKRTITTAPSSTPSRFSQLVALRRSASLTVLSAYMLGAALLSSCYIWSAGQLPWFYFDHKRDGYVLYERRVIITLLHAVLALYATYEHVTASRSRVVFDESHTIPLPARLKLKEKARIPIIVRSALVANAIFYLAYVSLRRPILRFIVTSVIGSYARPYLYAMLRRNEAFSFVLFIQSIVSSIFMFAIWETAHVCFEVYATQPMLVSQFGAQPNEALVAGLRSPDEYYQLFAFEELANLTLTDAARRKAIFADIKGEANAKGAWAEICRESLRLIGTELQRAKGRGTVQRPASAAPTTTSTSPRKTSSVPVKQENVFLPQKKTLLDSLAASATGSGSNSSASAGSASSVQAVSSAVSSSLTAVSSRVPSVFQTGGSASQVTAAPKAAAKAVRTAADKVVSWEERLSAWVPAAWRDVMFAKGASSTVEMCVPRRMETVWAIAALSNMLCASLKEDAYGVAQRDISRVLEAFVLYLEALESLERNLLATSEKSGRPGEKEEMSSAIQEQVTPVQAALRDGVREVVTEFEPYLGEFRFPPTIAARLQLLIDWG